MQICVENISYTYPGDIQALDNVTFQLEAGEKVALTGENGSGKTTLARLLNGLLKPQSGKIEISGLSPQNHTPAQMAHKVAYVFQNPDDQIFCQRVRDEIAFGPEKLGFSKVQINQVVDDAMNLTGLLDIGEKHPYDLGFSGRRMVTIASALAMQTPILIFDEPTAGLDSRELSIFCHILNDLNAKGKTSIVITHDMNFVAENLERVLLLQSGKLIIDNKTQEFFGLLNQIGDAGLEEPLIHTLGRRLGFANPPLNVQTFLGELENIVLGKTMRFPN